MHAIGTESRPTSPPVTSRNTPATATTTVPVSAADGSRRHRADEQHGGASRRKRHEGENDARKRRMSDGVADEALPLVDAERADGGGGDGEDDAAERDDLKGVVRQNVHRSLLHAVGARECRLLVDICEIVRCLYRAVQHDEIVEIGIERAEIVVDGDDGALFFL